jgi:hypothetical protein
MDWSLGVVLRTGYPTQGNLQCVPWTGSPGGVFWIRSPWREPLGVSPETRGGSPGVCPLGPVKRSP